jgi:hypothetical protein
MLKKIFTFTTFLLTGLFGFSLQTNAATTTWTNTNFYSTFYGFVSVCIPLDPNIEVLTISIPENTYFLYATGGIDSSITFNSGDSCSGSSREIEFADVDPNGSINKTYFFDYSDTAFVVKSMRIRIMHSFQNITPSGFNVYIADNLEFNQEAPYTVIYYNGLVEYDRKLFAVNVPQTTTPTRSGFLFDYWKDRNGEIYDYQLPPNETQLQLDINGNTVFYLYASFSDNTPVDIPPGWGFESASPPSDRPIDIILFNTGFYSIEGFMLLYVLLIVAATIGLWYIKAPLLVNLIVNIIITALFMIAGYFPFYIAFIMIALFVIILIQINKGGLLNE